MPKLQKVKIVKKAVRPYGGVEEPKPGMRGVIVPNSFTPLGSSCIRFTAKSMGYEWETGDDPDQRYIKVYMPNDCFVNI